MLCLRRSHPQWEPNAGHGNPCLWPVTGQQPFLHHGWLRPYISVKKNQIYTIIKQTVLCAEPWRKPNPVTESLINRHSPRGSSWSSKKSAVSEELTLQFEPGRWGQMPELPRAQPAGWWTVWPGWEDETAVIHCTLHFPASQWRGQTRQENEKKIILFYF